MAPPRILLRPPDDASLAAAEAARAQVAAAAALRKRDAPLLLRLRGERKTLAARRRGETPVARSAASRQMPDAPTRELGKPGPPSPCPPPAADLPPPAQEALAEFHADRSRAACEARGVPAPGNTLVPRLRAAVWRWRRADPGGMTLALGALYATLLVDARRARADGERALEEARLAAEAAEAGHAEADAAAEAACAATERAARAAGALAATADAARRERWDAARRGYGRYAFREAVRMAGVGGGSATSSSREGAAMGRAPSPSPSAWSAAAWVDPAAWRQWWAGGGGSGVGAAAPPAPAAPPPGPTPARGRPLARPAMGGMV